MKNTVKILAFLLLAGLVSQCKPSNTGPRSADEQVVYGPQIYLFALQKKQKASQAALYATLDSISRKMTEPKADIASLSKGLQTTNQALKAKMEAFEKESQQMGGAMYAALFVVPKPPPPPPPCLGCDELMLNPADLIIIYHNKAFQATISDMNGKVLATGTSDPAGQASVGVVKTSLDLKNSGFSGKAMLNIESPDGLAQTEIVVQGR